MANTIDRLMVVLGIKTEGFGSVRQQVKGFTEGTQRDLASLKGYLGGFFTAAFAGELIHATTELASRFKDLAEEGQTSLATIQRFDFIFRKAGLSGEKAVQVFDTLLDKRKKALEGDAASSKLFQDFGISESELRSLDDGVKLFERIAQSKNRAAYIDAFGVKSAGKIMAAAADTAAGVQAPSIMSDEAADTLKESAQTLENASIQFKAAAADFLAGVVRWVERGGDVVGGLGEEKTLRDRLNKELRGMKLGNDADKFKAIPSNLADQLAGNGNAALAAIADFLMLPSGKFKATSDSAESAYRNRKSGLASKAAAIDALIAEAPNLSDEELQLRIRALQSGKQFGVKPATATGPAAISADAFYGPTPYTMSSADRDEQNRAINKALNEALFKASNPAQKREELRRQLAADTSEADQLESQGKFDEAAKLRVGLVGKAQSLAELLATKPTDFKMDQNANVGAFIGGAAAGIDPQQNMKEAVQILKDILSEIEPLRYVVEANQRRPSDDLR